MADLSPHPGPDAQPEAGGAAAPLVSIGLPVYNGEQFIARSVQSILDQDFTDWELVVSDNGSTDRSMEIIEELADGDPRVVILRSETNRGAAWNYNNAFDHARGKYFRWHADDDWFEPTLIGKLVEALESDPEAVVAHSWTRFVDDDGNTTREFSDNLGVTDPDPHKRLGSVIVKLTFCNPVFGLIRTDVLGRTAKIASFPSSDATLLYELAVNGTFAVVPELLYNRRPGNSIKSNPSMKAVAEWFNPSGSGGRLPGIHQVKAVAEAVWRAPLSTTEKLTCMATFARYWPIDYARKSRRRARRRKQLQ